MVRGCSSHLHTFAVAGYVPLDAQVNETHTSRAESGDSEETVVDFASFTNRALFLGATRLTKTEPPVPQTVTPGASASAADVTRRTERFATVTAV
jgi:hypothetical protein